MSNTAPSDVGSDMLARLIAAAAITVLALVALPLAIPVVATRMAGDTVATKTSFWVVSKWHWVINAAGIIAVASLITVEVVLLARWISSGDAEAFSATDGWAPQLVPVFAPWAVINLLAGLLLLPVAWSLRRRRIATQVRTRQITDVIRQEKIENARKRAADLSTANHIGVTLDRNTGRITGTGAHPTTAPHPVGEGRQAFGVVNRSTVRTFADKFHDIRRVRDWINPTGTHLILPTNSSAVRALVIAESGAGKTVLLNDIALCATQYGWPVIVIDAKGDPADAEELITTAETLGHTATLGGAWDLFNGTADQVTAKLMRLMPIPDGANQYYLDEIRGVLQAVQHESPIRSVDDLRERIQHPAFHVRDQYDLSMVNQPIDRSGTTAGSRALQSLLVALRPLEKWIDDDGWSYTAPAADVTVVPLSPVNDAQAKLGDLLLLDLRNYLATRLEGRDKTPVLVIVDEFPQLVTGAQDPGDIAGSLFETARTAGVGLVLATQSVAGLSNDPLRRRRALSSGAALIFGRSKDPDEIVNYAGTIMRLESSSSGDELGAARAQHSYVIPPQDVREASDGAFWLVQSGALAPFRALPTGRPGLRSPRMTADECPHEEVGPAQGEPGLSDEHVQA
ncbi:type IV secretory system conjugative DNA transfer family protein [Marisediminicola senii]|uniref:hypothetical protein n=1 Tax=Marisediminicola senii TaxID=2711233 RepID=UPI0013EC0BEE|nr:hypothetical protein [Marisediminicola senii]